MSINSMIFLTAFLPVVFVLDRLCVRKTALKNILLLLASLVFYAWGEPVYIVLLLVSIAANYGIGLLLGCQRDESVAAKAVLAAGILVNLGILGYYKYFDFFLRIVNRLTGSEHEMRNIPLPIGISFFTFGAISYLMDLYRGHYEAEKNPLNMALYLSFFPKISVGPIARYRDFAPQLTNRQETVEKTAEGIRRFAYGLGKKVLVANIVGASVDKIYAQDITNVTGVMVWCAAILYAIQIYYDFSGFTDMAIGLGKMFGFDICENFNYPYLSGSIQEFWRRWHISLSSWFRDYLYIPLGGNRKGKARTYLNLAIVFFATGLWHGATTAFIAWGALHGFFIIVERIGFKKILDKIGFLRYVYTGLVVSIRLGDFPCGKSAASAAVHPQDADAVAVYAEHLCTAGAGRKPLHCDDGHRHPWHGADTGRHQKVLPGSGEIKGRRIGTGLLHVPDRSVDAAFGQRNLQPCNLSEFLSGECI